MAIRVIKSEQGFNELKSAWEDLFQSNSNHTPYQSWEWNFTWWKYFGSPERLRLLVAEEDGKLIGIAPFFLRKNFYGWPLPHLGFIGQKRTDYLDFVVRPGAEANFFQQLFKHLHENKSEWMFVELKDVPDTSTNLPFFFQEVGRVFPVLGWEAQRLCVTVPLTENWESFLNTLGKRTRKDVGYDRRFFEKNVAADFKIFTNSSAVFDGLKDLIAVYRSRWQDEKGATRFEEDAVAKFEREICELFSHAGWYRLYMLYANQEPVAGLSGYVRNNKYYADAYAHSPAFHKYSVGNVLLGMVIEDCIKNQWTELDLTRGDEPYKFRWNGKAKRNYHLKIFHSRTSMALASLAEGMYERASQSKTLNKLLAQYRKLKFGNV
jgi:CelD/BcsL family acetyltransferase involved in cellulose biosynthesis